MTDMTSLIAVASVVLLVAGFVKGVLGLGLPTIAIGLLGIFMPPAQAAALLVVPNLVTNAWQLATGPSLTSLVRRLWSLMLGIFAGTLIGAPFLATQGSAIASVMLGAALIVYAMLGLSGVRWQVTPSSETWLGPLVGGITGLVTAWTGVFVVPVVPYLQALDLGRDDLVQALGLSFMTSTVAFALALVITGSFHVTTASVSLAALVPALLGMLFGQRVRQHISQTLFRRCFFSGLLILGAYLVWRSAR